MGIAWRQFHLRRQVQLSYYKVRSRLCLGISVGEGHGAKGLQDQFTDEETRLKRKCLAWGHRLIHHSFFSQCLSSSYCVSATVPGTDNEQPEG